MSHTHWYGDDQEDEDQEDEHEPIPWVDQLCLFLVSMLGVGLSVAIWPEDWITAFCAGISTRVAAEWGYQRVMDRREAAREAAAQKDASDGDH